MVRVRVRVSLRLILTLTLTLNSDYTTLLVISWNNWFHNFTVTYICVCTILYLCLVRAEIFNRTSHPKTRRSGWKLDTWQPYRWMVMFWDMTDFCIKLLKTEWKVNQWGRRPNATWFGKWWWLCCTQTGSWGQRRMETEIVKNRLYCIRLYWWWQAAIPTATILKLSSGPW